MLTKEELPACPVATTVQLIRSKWKLLIMRNLLVRPWRFNELKRDLQGISQNKKTGRPGEAARGKRGRPVSYTHLDVYKRQTLAWPRRRFMILPGASSATGILSWPR